VALSACSLVIGTPCSGGQVSWLYTASLLKLQRACARRNVSLGFLLQPGDSLITRARQTVVAHFLQDFTATHLLFIDADIGFEPEQVFRLIDFGEDFTAAAYPIKKINWDLVPGAVALGRTPLESAALHYAVEADPGAPLTTRDGFVKVQYVGTGFMLIRRNALERMIERYPKLRYAREHKGEGDPLANSPWRSALFNCLIDEATGTYLSEDYSFCKRWTDMGGEIWVDYKSRLSHVGTAIFRGDISAQADLPPE
jgi:hypothetical protein